MGKHKFYFSYKITSGVLCFFLCLLALCHSPTAQAQVITTIAGTAVPGFSGDGGPATAAQFNNPKVATDNAGNIFIADYSNYRIRKIDPSGIVTTVVDSVFLPGWIAGDGTNIYYWSNPHLTTGWPGPWDELKKRTPSGAIMLLAGGGTYDATDGYPATSGIFDPLSMGVDTAGKVYLSNGVLSRRFRYSSPVCRFGHNRV
jgi:hypothetical protein